MRQLVVVRALAMALLLFVPTAASAQTAAISGTVRDVSGGVLPGVTVEASSPALIEKVRSVTTDENGQYRIQALPVGVYTITFTLPGFTPASRSEVQLTTGFTANVDADLRVGLAETVSVIGEAPIVDVESAQQRLTVDGDALRELPTGRTANALVGLVPAIQGGTTGPCLGGTCGYTLNAYSAHGGNATEGRLQVDGMGVGAAIGGAGVSGYLADVANSQEISVTLSGSLGEAEVGGPVINVVPRTGGNRFTGSYFTSYTSERLFDRNNEDFPHINVSTVRERDYDVNGSFGGPLVRDRLWFFFAPRVQGSRERISNAFFNLNEGVFGANYQPDTSRPALQENETKNASIRLTWQASVRNKINLFWDEQAWCVTCSGTGSAATSPEAVQTAFVTPNHIAQASWTNPFTSRLLFEAGVSLLNQKWGISPRGENNVYDNIPRITEIGPGAHNGLVTSGGATYWDADAGNQNVRASASYISGAHNIKVGYQGAFLNEADLFFTNSLRQNYTYFSFAPTQLPTPFSVAMTYPVFADERTSFYGIYAQDQWTINRFTIQGAVRYDHAWSWFPDVCVNEDVFIPETFCFGQDDGRTEGVSYDDITPRWSVAWDVFGDGRTAIKYNMGKYLQPANVGGLYNATNPIRRLGNFFGFGAPASAGRTWADLDGDRVVDCDLRNASPNGECPSPYPGNLAQFGTDPRTNGQGFATTQCGLDISEFPNAVSPQVLDYCAGVGPGAPAEAQNVVSGWGKREYDWQFGLGIQHEVLPRVSAEVTYNRRWYGNFLLTDNVSVGCNLDQACLANNANLVNPSYDFYSITVPDDPALPGGGRTITGLADLDPGFVALPTRNAVSITNDQTRYWHGVDTNVTWRARGGLRLQGGTSTGRQVTDTCEIQVNNPSPRNCHVADPFQTSVRGSASYVVPFVDVLVSTVFQYRPGVERSANFAISCPGGVCPGNIFQWAPTAVENLTGDPRTTLSAGQTSISNNSFNLLDEGALYGDGFTNFDLKLAKILRFGRTRTNIGVDVYNLFNSDAALGYVDTYPFQTVSVNGVATQVPWGTPDEILAPRFVRFSVQFDF